MTTPTMPVLAALFFVVSALSLISGAPIQKPCSPCSPGWGLTRLCTSSNQTLCHVCPPQTYSPRHPHLSQCTPCSKCGEGLYEEKKCKRYRDTKCDSCDTVNGRFNEDFVKKCQIPSKIGHEKPGSLLQRADDNMFNFDLVLSTESDSSDENLTPILDSDEEFWKNVEFENSKILSSSSSASSEEEAAQESAEFLSDVYNFPDMEPRPLNIGNGVHRYAPIYPDQPSVQGKSEPADPNPLDLLNDEDNLIFNGEYKYTPIPIFDPLPDSFDADTELSRDDSGDDLYDDLSRDFKFVDSDSDEDTNTETMFSAHSRDLLNNDFVDPFDPNEGLHDGWGVRRILPFWQYFDNPQPEHPDESNPQHRFKENDGDQYILQPSIPVKPSSRLTDVQTLLRAQHRRFSFLSVIACIAFMTSLALMAIMMKRCWQANDADWHGRYQQLQIQLSPSDNKIIKECAAKFDNSEMLDRLRNHSREPDREPLIRVQENPMALVHYLEHSTEDEWAH